MDKPVAGVGNNTSPTPVPSVSDAPVEAEPVWDGYPKLNR